MEAVYFTKIHFLRDVSSVLECDLLVVSDLEPAGVVTLEDGTEDVVDIPGAEALGVDPGLVHHHGHGDVGVGGQVAGARLVVGWDDLGPGPPQETPHQQQGRDSADHSDKNIGKQV